MTRIEILDNLTHKDIKVNAGYAAELGDNIASTITFITEFAEVQKEYPILCRKDTNTGQYQAVVVFGLRKDENLFLTEPGAKSASNNKHAGWSARYIPAVVAKGPFSIGIQNQTEGGVEKKVPIVHIDREHPKVGFEGGVRLFLDHGGNSPYLVHISNILNLIRDGVQRTTMMFTAFQKYQLLEEVNIEIELVNGDKHRIAGFQTIDADKLQALSAEALGELGRAGFLQAAYFIVASMSNIQTLIDMKNRKLKSLS